MSPRPLVLIASAMLAAVPARGAIEEQRRPRREEAPEPPPAPVLTRAPELLTFASAPYPASLLAAGVDGEVTMVIDIDAAGEVTRVEVTAASHPDFAPPALAAACAFVFSPAEIDDAPAPIRIEYTYRFIAHPTLAIEPDAIAGEPDTSPFTGGSGVLSGMVLEAGVRAPVSGAVIAVDGRPVAETDAEGHFRIEGLDAGAREVKITSSYHTSVTVSEELAAGEQLDVAYYLVRRSYDPYDPYETVVRARVPRREVARIQLSRREVSRVPGTAGDPIKVLENLPGMARTPGGLGGSLLVRGGTPADSRVFIDGVEVPIIYHFGGLVSVVNAQMLDRIDFFPGGFSARYGSAIAGVVDVVSRDLDCEVWHGNADVALLDAEASTCLPLGDGWAIAAAGRRSYVDALVPAILDAIPRDDDEGVLTLAPVYADYQLKIEGRRGRHELTFFLFGSDDRFELIQRGSAESVDVDFGFHQGFSRALLRDRWRIGDHLTLSSQVAFGYELTELKSHADEIDFATSFSLQGWRTAVREEVSWEITTGLTLRGGFDGTFGTNALAMEVPIPTELHRFPSPIFDFTQVAEFGTRHGIFNHAYWLEGQWEPGFGLTVVPGLRVDRWDFYHTQDLSVQPRLNVRWELVDGVTAKAAYGLFEKLPEPQNLADRPLGNPALRPLQAHHFIAGFEHELTDLIEVDLQGYYIRRERLVSRSSDIRFHDGEAVPRVWANDGGGETVGLELLVRHLATEPGSGGGGSILDRLRGRFYGWIAYTLSRTMRWDRQPGSTYTIAQGEGVVLTRPYSDRSARAYNADFDQTHILTIVGQMILPFGFELGARFRLVSGNPFTPRQAGSPSLDVDADSYDVDLSDVDRNSARMPPFHQLDVRLDKTWTFDLWRIAVYLEVFNVYNQSNVEQYQYDYRSRERAPVTLLPILPVLGLEGTW